MKQIKIGTCVPGAKAEEWLKGFIGKGFETFSLNFHMSLEGTDLDKLALSTEKTVGRYGFKNHDNWILLQSYPVRRA